MTPLSPKPDRSSLAGPRIPNKKITKAVVPAAGLGTRFLPATKAQPKEMLPIYDKPAIQYVIEEAVAAGIKDILVVTGRGKQAIENHFDRSVELEETLQAAGKKGELASIQEISNMVNLHYVRQKEAKGLGHAVLCAKSFIGNDPFAVFLGDDIIDHKKPAICQLMAIWEKYHSPVLAVEEVPLPRTKAYGIIKPKSISGRLYQVLDLVEKPKPEQAPSRLGIVGRYILTPQIFSLLEKTKPGSGGEIQLTDALRRLNAMQPIYAWQFEGVRHDIGNKLEFVKATLAYALKDKTAEAALKEFMRQLVAQ
ncbi:UTP--glucose-1-phosphate uridylyltransferase GalU [candidate division FCPU426 bacterium]|nr:UTP--glucose-1-phosphate uridylyltransferase GalU [candidate division FCPU426 bacterium]